MNQGRPIVSFFLCLALSCSAFRANATSGPTGSGDRGGGPATSLSEQGVGGDPEACPTPEEDALQPDPGAPVAPSPAKEGSSKTLLPAGSPASGFALADLKGSPLIFSAGPRTKPALVIFWSVFCEICNDEFPLYKWLADRYGMDGLETVGVNLDGPKMSPAVEAFLTRLEFPLTVAVDRKQGTRFLAADAYGVTGTPSLFLIDKTGTVRWSHAGRVSVEQIEAAIRQVLAR